MMRHLLVPVCDFQTNRCGTKHSSLLLSGLHPPPSSLLLHPPPARANVILHILGYQRLLGRSRILPNLTAPLTSHSFSQAAEEAEALHAATLTPNKRFINIHVLLRILLCSLLFFFTRWFCNVTHRSSADDWSIRQQLHLYVVESFVVEKGQSDSVSWHVLTTKRQQREGGWWRTAAWRTDWWLLK